MSGDPAAPPGPDAASAPRARFPAPLRRPKPWGEEALFAGGEHGYVGKLLTVRAGQALSLQYHVEKDETIVVVTGEAVLEHGGRDEPLASRTIRPGDVVHLPPGARHRITATTDLLLVEASTAAPGWQDDVVRLEDRYGRAGTSAP
ncbi:cupin domain-containing protein [Cellulomonas endophytica]|uniref:cupin domain-containing protein n=1 Tax=Cellulomonas endophytica TaxID=2494735 RepID=UPI00196AC767|nr:cupin domain-containing protein [Cellulomonas endophytica]